MGLLGLIINDIKIIRKFWILQVDKNNFVKIEKNNIKNPIMIKC